MDFKLDLEEQKDEILINDLYNNDFKQKLEEALKEGIWPPNYSMYQKNYTNENIDRIWDMYDELKYNYANENTMSNCDIGKIYLIQSVNKDANTAYLNEYDGTTMNKQEVLVNMNDLPNNIQENIFLRKKEDKYIIDEVATIDFHQKMENFLGEVYHNQNQDLESMRKEGNIYKISYLEDDCECFHTILENINTKEKFQELDFPHDIYHNVGDYVKYENGKYSILSKTERYINAPYDYEYCERESCYYTRFGKIEHELFEDKLEKTFIEAKKANKSTKSFFADLKIKTQIIFNSLKMRL